MKQPRIEIFTRSMNHRLYACARQTFEALGYPCHRLLGTTADGYLKRLLRSRADYVVNIDEDAFITDPAACAELIEYCIDKGIVNCGMPDGGVLPIRTHNPLVTNPFFNVLDVRTLRLRFSEREMNKYAVHRSEYEQRTPYHLLRDGVSYLYDDFEPYYPFFLWTSQNFETLYLDGAEHSDGYSTILRNHLGKPFLIHTWYSRDYGRKPFHTERIDRIINGLPNVHRRDGVLDWAKTWQDRVANKVVLGVRKKIEKFRARRRPVAPESR